MITERHELLERYLTDLERRLAAADPGERADILASVREHVESDLAALGRPATSADVAAALESLGSVDTVAAAWTPEDGGAAPGAVGDAAPARPGGLAVAAGVLAALGVLLIWLPPVGGLLGLAALVVGIVALRRRDEPRWAAVTAVAVGATSAVLGLLLVLLPLALFAVHEESGGGPAVVESVVPAG